MILTENKEILRMKYRDILDLIDHVEINQDVQVISSKSGHATLKVQADERPLFIHSKYNPIKEAESWVKQFQDIKKYDHILFYGCGLGYHIDFFIQEHPDVSFSIFEPSVDIFYAYLCNQKLKNLMKHPLKNIFIESHKQKIELALSRLVKETGGNILLVSVPSYERVFAKQYKTFVQQFKQSISQTRVNVQAGLALEKEWTINSTLNFPYILNTPNILHNINKIFFRDKPILLVSAGPSLNYEIENIREIKEQHMAYVFAVGSAINTLIKHHIFPDAVFALDPREKNFKVFKKIIDSKIDQIPLVFGSTATNKVIKQYPGPKVHYLTSQDQVTRYYAQYENGEKPDFVFDAPTVAVAALQVLYKLECTPIILVGQNLAYHQNRSHAFGIDYHDKELNEDEQNKLFEVTGVDGTSVLTSDGFNRMRLQFEMHIAQHQTKVINTTKGGAHIEGTKYMPLKEVIELYLHNEGIKDSWLDTQTRTYKNEDIIRKQKMMDNHFKRVHETFIQIEQVLDDIQKSVKMRKVNQLENQFKKFDRTVKKLSNNKFFQVYLQPMSRVQLEVINQNLSKLKNQENLINKGEKIIKYFTQLLEQCRQNSQNITPLYEEMKKDLLMNANK